MKIQLIESLKLLIIFYGEKLLTTPNPEANDDMALFGRLGIVPERHEVCREPETPHPQFYDATR